MRIKCQECNTYVDVDENEYEKEVEQSIECPLCSSEIRFTIHKEIPKVESAPVVDNQQKSGAKPIKVAPKPKHFSEKEKTTEEPLNTPEPVVVIEDTGSGSNFKGIIIGIIAIVAIVGGYLYYDNIYLPQKIDAEAPRSYTFASSLVMRSSKMAGADYNKVASLPYGTELITYNKDSEWAEVKLKGKGSSDDIKGYVSSAYLLSKSDFFLLNSIFGNADAKETISTSKCRIALLNYYKENKYIGQIDESMRKEAGINIVPNSNNQWQVFTKQKDAKPNSVYYKKIINSNSKFTDFAVIITNIKTDEKKLLYFYFDDDETPHFATEFQAPQSGSIKKIDSYRDYEGNLVISAK